MKWRSISLYTRVFLLVYFLWILIVVWNLVSLGCDPLKAVIASIISGIVIGLLGVILTVLFHEIPLKRLRPNSLERMLGNHQVSVVTIDQPIEEAFNICLLSLKNMGDCRIAYENFEAGVISAKTGKDWDGSGERIVLTVSASGMNSSIVTISSKLKNKIAPLDAGKNIENVRYIEKAIFDQTCSIPDQFNQEDS